MRRENGKKIHWKTHKHTKKKKKWKKLKITKSIDWSIHLCQHIYEWKNDKKKPAAQMWMNYWIWMLSNIQKKIFFFWAKNVKFFFILNLQFACHLAFFICLSVCLWIESSSKYRNRGKLKKKVFQFSNIYWHTHTHTWNTWKTWKNETTMENIIDDDMNPIGIWVWLFLSIYRHMIIWQWRWWWWWWKVLNIHTHTQQMAWM